MHWRWNFFAALWLTIKTALLDLRTNLWRRMPVTWTVTLLCIGLFLVPNADTWLMFDSRFVRRGEFWRLFSVHFVHANGLHLGWNLYAVVVGGLTMERLHQKLLLAYLVAAVLLLQPLVWGVSGWHYQRGLGFSDIGSGLFALILLYISKLGWQQREFWIGLVPLLMLAAFAAHEAGFLGQITFLEWISGAALNPRTTKPGHLLGIGLGITVFAVSQLRLMANRQAISGPQA